MDLFDKISQALDDFGVAKDDSDTVVDDKDLLGMAEKAASFILTISNPEERKRVIVEALGQAYKKGLETGRR